MELGGIASTAVSVAVMIFTIIAIGGAAVGGFIVYSKWKKYGQFDCVIYARDGFGQLVQKRDTAGIFVDSKTKNKRFFLRYHNVGLDPDSVPFIPGVKGKKTVYLLQTGLKNFQFINMRLSEGRIDLNVGEEDVNWAINSYERQKKLFQQNLWVQLMPFIVLAFISIVILILFIYFFKEFDVLREVAVSLNEAAQAQARCGVGGTAVLGG